jgi:hypothetical protein
LVGEPIGIHYGTVSNFSAKSFIITFVANITSNIVVPRYTIREKLTSLLEKIWVALKVDRTIFPFGFPTIDGPGSFVLLHEDVAKIFFHIILVIITFALFFKRSKRKEYGLIVLGSWCMFAFCIPWQPWITRLQLPLFALCAPVFSLALENEKYAKYRKYSLLFLSLFAIFPLFLNRSRPLLLIPRGTSPKTIWNSSREEVLFNNKTQEYFNNYRGACEAVVQTNVQNIGLVIGGNSWEYPLWRYIRKKPSNKKMTIKHVKGNAIDQDVEVLFVFEAQVSFLKLSPLPLVLRRDEQDASGWKVLFQGYP